MPEQPKPVYRATDAQAHKAWRAFSETWAQIADPTSPHYKGTKSGYDLAVAGMKKALEAALNG
jgi:hypothetical protein